MSFPKHPGVYAIIHEESGKLYIGSAKNIYSRWRIHKSLLRRGLHHSPHLQNSWNKHGEAAFQFSVLESCLKDAVILCSREQHWLDKYRDKLLNAARYAEPNYCKAQSEKQKRAVSKALKGNKHGQGHSYHGVLTEQNVIEILHRCAAGEYSIDLAKRFNVSQATISRITSRKIWRGVKVPPEVEAMCRARTKRGTVGVRHWRAKLDVEKAEDIRRRYAAGESLSSLARYYGVTPTAIQCVVTGKTWKEPLAPVMAEIPSPPQSVFE